MADYYGKIGQNRIVKFAAKREPSSASYLTSRSVKDCRLSARTTPKVRVKTNVGITGGRGTGALSNGRPMRNSKNARRKAIRYGR